MKKIITPIFVLISLITFGQNPQAVQLNKIYMSKNFKQAIVKANEFLKNDPNNIDYKMILGRALTDVGSYKEAIPYLEYTVDNDPDNTWKKAWALDYLGTCYFMQLKYDDSKKALDDCLSLNATKNATNDANGKSLLFGFDKFFTDWEIVESENFRFHFQNMSNSDIKNYISTRELAFQNINKFFESDLPKRIDFFVWNSREDAKRIINANLGFASPGFCVLHSHYQQTVGHEMTHVISNFSTTIINKTGLINEGTSVCFDQTNQDREQRVKDWIKTNNIKISIEQIWANWKDYPDELSYPLSGLFVKALIDNFGREKFIEFFGNQTYDNAKIVLGEEIDKVIQEFENKMNS